MDGARCGERCGVGNTPSAMLATFAALSMATESPDVPVRGCICVPLFLCTNGAVFPRSNGCLLPC